MIISRTPYRISLFGGGTDFPEWYLSNGGACISFTIDKFSYVLCKELPPFFSHKYRVSMSKIELASEISDISFAPIREAIKLYASHFSGVEIHHQGELPARSGLGSSSAFAVGLIHALIRLSNKFPSQSQLAREAIHFEQNVLSEIVGSQDQIACSYGGLNLIYFQEDGTWLVDRLRMDPDKLTFLNEHFVLVYSGIERISSNISKPLIGRFAEKGKILDRTRTLVDECAHILNGDASNFPQIGELLHESWSLKKQLNPLAVTRELEEIYSFALGQGALGGKILGAGGGGFILFFVPPEKREGLIGSLSRYVNVPFSIGNEGSQTISNWSD